MFVATLKMQGLVAVWTRSVHTEAPCKFQGKWRYPWHHSSLQSQTRIKMSTFWGYMFEACALSALWMWWLINTYVSAIKCQSEDKPFLARISYNNFPGTRHPVETIYKIAVSALGCLATFFYEGVSFTDTDGNYRKMATVISLSIYGIFLVHSLLELMVLLGTPLIRDCHYVAGALGFLWYALATFYRAHDFQQDAHVAVMVKTLPLYPLLAIGACLLWEMDNRHSFCAQMLRVASLGLVTTWNFNSAFILHKGSSFPGKEQSSWDMMAHSNTAFIGAAFGDHICFHLIFLTTAFVLTALVMRVRYGVSISYREAPGWPGLTDD
ncbi:dermal papilla derived protein [Plakobranchus ocellatus]|uniref:Dermal papilla derived protein n=1 Tax=Plakobranchus ocellatus TaxID=259542 RepID=A0AAV4A3A4_9GAST|nr:dermal papilla derived protein [Plakobranchus ocellatus]